jgi:PAS domain S-box-containing protein
MYGNEADTTHCEASSRSVLEMTHEIQNIERTERERAHLASIVEFSNDAIVSKTLEGIIVSWNAGAHRMFGYTAEEMIGQPILLLIPKELRAEEDLILSKIRAGERIEHYETERLTKDGHRVPVSLTISPLKDARGKIIGASKIARDITERKLIEEARRASEERYRTLFDLGPVAVYSCEASGVIRDFNRRAVELWGREPKPGDTDELFCGSQQLLRPDGTYLPHDQCPMAQVLSGKSPEARDMEIQIERPDGSRVMVIVNIRVLKNERGEITGAINCFVDITERQRAQEEERKTAKKLKQTTEDLKHFAYAASHDLQEPLRIVTSFTQLLSKEYKGTLDEKADKYIAYAVEGAERMEALLRAMREYWEASERGEDHRTAVDGNEVLHTALLNLQETIAKTGATVTHTPLPSVWAQEGVLVQVFQNLVGNAIKYRSEEPPRVHVSAAENSAGEWEFSVRDNGIGIAPEFTETIFTMFSRLNGNKYRGSGIGLALCRKVVERLGGRIWVESELGRGSDFRFTIPH